PMILFVHIPLYMPSMRMCCGHPEWGARVDKNHIVERRERWPERGNSPSTVEFIKQVSNAENVAGVFAGHWHSYRTVNNSGLHQHLALPALNGSYRMITVQPMES